jgi:VanZ family protein
LKPFLPAFFWSIVILALSLGRSLQMPDELWNLLGWDKIGHFGVYLIECVLLLWGFYRVGRRHPLPAILISILFGVLMEGMQYAFFPHRFFEWADVLANTLGTFAGYLVFKQLTRVAIK